MLYVVFSGQVFPMLRQRFTIPLLITLILLAVGGSALWWSLINRESVSQTVRVGFYDAPPFQTLDPQTGAVGGFYIDLLEGVARRKGLNLEYVVLDSFSQMLDALRDGTDIHMAVALSTIATGREFVVFSWPSSITTLNLAGKAVEPDGRLLDSMEDRWIGFTRGMVQGEICLQWASEGKIGGCREFETPGEATRKMLAGEVDFVFDEIESIEWFRSRHGVDMDVIDDPSFTVVSYEGFPVVRGHEWLLEKLNSGLREMMYDGEYSRIYHKHMTGEAIADDEPYTVDRLLPRVEIDHNYDARAIRDQFFDEISSRSSDMYDERLMKVIDDTVTMAYREFEYKLQRSRVRLEELLLLLQSRPQHTPYVAFFYLDQINDLKTSFEDIHGTLDAYGRRFKKENTQTKSKLRIIQNLNIPQPELQWQKSWIETNLAPIIAIQSRWIEKAEEMSRKCESFQEELVQIMAEKESRILDDYDEYKTYQFDFFGNTKGTGIAYQWVELSRILKTWLKTLPTQLRVLLPNAIWWPVLLHLLLLTLSAAGVMAGLVVRFQWFDLKGFLRPYVLAWAGLYFAVGMLVVPSINNDLFFLMTMLFWSLSIMDVAWRIRKRGWGVRGVNPFFAFVISFCLIDLLTGVLAPFKVISASLLVLSVINLLWLSWCALYQRRRHKWDIYAALLTGCLIWASAGTASWLGYLYPAMAIATLGGMTLCTVFAGMVFTRSLAASAGRMAESSRSLASFLLTLVIPLLWIALIFGVVHWVADVFNAGQFFIQFYTIDLAPSFPIRISLKLLLFLFLLGLFIKFALSWIENMLSVFMESRKVDSGTVHSVFIIVQYLVWSIYIIYTLASLGIDWDNLKWVVGGLSVGFGFALKDILENFFCGLILLIGRQVRPGDVVEFGDVLGKVIKINVRATFIETYDNAIIAIPNTQIVGKEFRNWTLNGHIRRLEIDVGVAYDSDVPMVVETLLEAMNTSSLVLKVRDPQVLFLDFGENAMIFRARFWIHLDNWVKAPTALRMNITEMFRAKGIVIAFPQVDVHFDHPDAKTLRHKEAVPVGVTDG